jgi:hypothetical protein
LIVDRSQELFFTVTPFLLPKADVMEAEAIEATFLKKD